MEEETETVLEEGDKDSTEEADEGVRDGGDGDSVRGR